jgi:hypothetical protein
MKRMPIQISRRSALHISFEQAKNISSALFEGPIPGKFAGQLDSSIVHPETGRVLSPLAQIAIDEGESIAHNLEVELDAGLSLVTRLAAGCRIYLRMRLNGNNVSR